jgi:hypothetical protein
MSILKTEKPKELRIIRWGIILMIIGTVTVIGLQEYFHLPEHEKNFDSKVMSGFGEITMFSPQKYSDPSEGELFTNRDLGFQVLRPNNKWDAHSILEVFSPEKLEYLKSKGLIHGFYLEENHEKQFLITVFDIPEKNFELDSYIDSQISQMEIQTNVNVPIKQISVSNEWAIFAMETPTEKWNYGEQVLLLKENRLYMLQYTGQNPGQVGYETKSEYLSVIDSFELI